MDVIKLANRTTLDAIAKLKKKKRTVVSQGERTFKFLAKQCLTVRNGMKIPSSLGRSSTRWSDNAEASEPLSKKKIKKNKNGNEKSQKAKFTRVTYWMRIKIL